MDALPFPKSLYEKAKTLNVKIVTLAFSGGNDEGYLNVSVESDDYDKNRDSLYVLESDIEEWAWEVYDYSGAGDGTDYGDDVIYDLVNSTVETQTWFMEPQYQDPEKNTMEIGE